MMVYLSAAVALVGALCIFDLLLSLGVIRRLREQNEMLNRLSGATLAATLPIGQTVGLFTATTTAGHAVSRNSLERVTLVGFFSPSCAACTERVPEFIDYAAHFAGKVLAVAVGAVKETAGLAEQLGAAGEVIVEPDGGPASLAFAVSALPALCVVNAQGQVLASGTEISALPTAVAH